MATAAQKMTREFPFTDEDFRYFAGRVKELTGIVISDSRRDMLYARLSRRLRALNLVNFADYRAFVAGPRGAAEIGDLINAVTTNLTHFFRESHHFDHLRDVALPAVMAANRGEAGPRLRLWSAGCSSGEEPYSITMTVLSAPLDLARWNLRILATDLDTDMVATAAAGRYRASDAKGIPTKLAGRYAEEVMGARGAEFLMRDSVKQLIAFKQLNLMGPWPMRGPFDAIFCRNVMIYFDDATKARLVDRFADLLSPRGWLYIGHSESLAKVSSRFELVGRTIYRRVT